MGGQYLQGFNIASNRFHFTENATETHQRKLSLYIQDI